MGQTFSTATTAGAVEVHLRHHLLRAMRRAGLQAGDRGASAVEWVVITAAIIGIAVVVGGILLTTIRDAATNVTVPNGGGIGGGGGGGNP